ncbi:MAG: 4-alpha-glucanotransferase [Deltaproteobacteria bacterium]|jgi:4-alpha-glucanotransferase|nr:4-alpha-glucanotransferase [Deltaproteobacteria bacterium]
MRSFGILLHISSLPSAFGCGDLGPAAHAFARALGAAGAGLWQFLPLNPTSGINGHSPYSSPSAFAGNTLFISPEWLARDGYLAPEALEALPRPDAPTSRERVNFEAALRHRTELMRLAYEHSRRRLENHADFKLFCREHDYWLHDYARFVTLKEEQGGNAWTDWPEDLRRRDPAALELWDAQAFSAMQREKFAQYLFFSQWRELRSACAREKVRLLADVPIYVTMDSADVWANAHLFNLDEDLRPVAVSGVPPDYFSATGQRWGSPLYRWDRLQQDGFLWWKRRLAHVLLLADLARLDHFRGFCGYWSIPAEEETAVKGVWKKAPGREFFQSIRDYFGGLPFVAENLGVITADVRKLMEDLALPGMHVLQFAFAGPDPAFNPAVPHRHTPCSVVYTGTHDNAPSRGWFSTAESGERKALLRYVGLSDPRMETFPEEQACPLLTRLAFASVADAAVVPMQDALNLGLESRMNMPGITGGNWSWRMRPEEADPGRLAWLSDLAGIYGRLPAPAPEDEEKPLYADESL